MSLGPSACSASAPGSPSKRASAGPTTGTRDSSSKRWVSLGHVTLGPISACQICGGSDLRSALFLGFLPPVNSMRPLGTPADAEPWYPAELLVCPACHLAQLGFVVEPAVLFPPGYPYTSGSTRVLRDNFADLYREVQARFPLDDDDLVARRRLQRRHAARELPGRRTPRARHRADRHRRDRPRARNSQPCRSSSAPTASTAFWPSTATRDW